jgi:RNA polymerase sigma-70 factor (ECF subfamily)
MTVARRERLPHARRRLLPEQATDVRRAYRENVAAVYAFMCYSVDADTAQDLTSATFERAVRSWAHYDEARATPRTWIFSIARNIVRDHHRRQVFRKGPSLDEHPALADRLASLDDPAARCASVDLLKACLRALTSREREVLALRYGADLSVEEIAECLGLSTANVHQVSSRALRRLRAAFPSLARFNGGGSSHGAATGRGGAVAEPGA